MHISNAFIKWKKWNDQNQHYFSSVVILLLSIAFVLSDWMYSYFTFAEYILFIILAFFIFTLQIYISKKQLYYLMLLGVLLLLHTILQIYLNDNFQLNIGIVASIKLLFYFGTITSIYNYIMKYGLEKKLLTFSSIIAVIIIILGVFITIQLKQDSRIPQELFWRFTRRDIYSYYFESNPSIIRTRSLFSEPAHMGFYLNTILAAIMFSKFKFTLDKFISVFIITGIVLTFSYSMIGIMILIILLKIILLVHHKKLKWNNWMLTIPIVVGIVLYSFWDTVNTTLIDRTIRIFSGEDISARMRLLDSWQYVSRENIIIGNGLGHTPIITNIYAYALSDLGIVGLLMSITGSVLLIYNKWIFGIIFVLLNTAKGGYLSSSYWFMILFILTYSNLDQGSIKPYNEKGLVE